MSIEQMTSVSYVMFGISGVFAVAAAVLFFVLDITKCWRMVSGKHCAAGKKRQKAERTVPARKAVTEKLRRYPTEEIRQSGMEVSMDVSDEANVQQNDRAGAGDGTPRETVWLGGTGTEETEPLGTVDLEMIQDIVYMEDAAKID